MRIWFVVAVLAPNAVIAAIMLILSVQQSLFRRAVPELRTPDDLTRFKALAAFQMRASLVGLRLLWVPFVVWVVGKFAFAQLGWLDLLLCVLLPLALVTLLATALVENARAVRATPASDAAIEAERDRVVDVWLHRNHPDW